MKINSNNEWDKLREIVVGRGEGQAPLLFTAPGQISEDLLKKANRLAREASPKWLIDEINEDLEGLSNTLKSFGIKVYRPETSHVNSFFATPYFRAAGDYCYNIILWSEIPLLSRRLKKSTDILRLLVCMIFGMNISKKGFAGLPGRSRDLPVIT